MSRKKSPADFHFGARIGEGSYSSVYKAIDSSTRKVYAIKVLSKKHIVKENKIKYVNIEKITLNRLGRHPGVVTLHYTFQDEQSLYFVIDFAEQGELLTLIRRLGSFSETLAKYYMVQLIDAVDFMHSKGVIHRDLKPENILVNSERKIMITDFGAAKVLDLDEDGKLVMDDDTFKKGSFVGTAEYVSPELLKFNKCGFESDVWAIGCILYQFIVGIPPFKGKTEYMTFEKIVSLQYSWPGFFIPELIKDLVSNLLKLDPLERLTIAQIRQHDWFSRFNWADKSKIWAAPPPALEPYRPLIEQQLKANTSNFQKVYIQKPKKNTKKELLNSTISQIRNDGLVISPQPRQNGYKQAQSPGYQQQQRVLQPPVVSQTNKRPQSSVSPMAQALPRPQAPGGMRPQSPIRNQQSQRNHVVVTQNPPVQLTVQPKGQVPAQTQGARSPLYDLPKVAKSVQPSQSRPEVKPTTPKQPPPHDSTQSKVLPTTIISKLANDEAIVKLDFINLTELPHSDDRTLTDLSINDIIQSNKLSLESEKHVILLVLTDQGNLFLFQINNTTPGNQLSDVTFYLKISLTNKFFVMYDYEFNEAAQAGFLILEIAKLQKLIFLSPLLKEQRRKLGTLIADDSGKWGKDMDWIQGLMVVKSLLKTQKSPTENGKANRARTGASAKKITTGAAKAQLAVNTSRPITAPSLSSHKQASPVTSVKPFSPKTMKSASKPPSVAAPAPPKTRVSSKPMNRTTSGSASSGSVNSIKPRTVEEKRLQNKSFAGGAAAAAFVRASK